MTIKRVQLGVKRKRGELDLRSLGNYQACFLTGHLQDLELLGGPFLAASGLVSVGVGHV